MNELVPIFFGLSAGLLIGALTTRRGVITWVIVSIVLGAAATFLTGEWLISWAFLLIDIPLVACSAVCGHLLARHVTMRWLDARRSS